MTKSGREIMEIFEAFDLTGTAWSAAQLAGCDANTVARYVAVRDAGGIRWRGPRATAADRRFMPWRPLRALYRPSMAPRLAHRISRAMPGKP